MSLSCRHILDITLATRSSNSLNEYQLKFLELLVLRGVRFLIVGGQARSVHEGTRTRDLDIWVDISKANRSALERSLADWNARYPTHSTENFSSPLNLRPGVQIKFPDGDVMFIGSDNKPKEIGPADGIDILTSIGSSCFKDFYDRAYWLEIAGIKLPFVPHDDLETISPKK